MKRFTILFLTFAFNVYAAEPPKYPVKEIPAELLKDANAVIRKESLSVSVESIGHAKKHYLCAITILNKQAEHWAEHVIGYDKLRTVRDFRASLYDAEGKLIRKLKSSEIVDTKAYEDNSLYTDNRYKVAELKTTRYPYTVEFESEVAYNGLLFIPGWQPVSDLNISLQEAEYTVSMPQSIQLRFREKFVKPAEKSVENGKTRYQWTLKDQHAFTSKPYNIPMHEYSPSVLAAPTEFEIEGFRGDMSDWRSFGLWSYKLNAGRDILPENVKLQVHKLCDNITDTLARAKILYEFLQKNTRYISVQLGIGGWQTFDAKYVGTKGYGDCKALTNYMMALLKEAGIKSYATMIDAGDDPESVFAEFPSQQFNHVILSVPLAQGTVWLECTSQNAPFNYLGQSTANRWALKVTENGGELVKTPALGYMSNREQREIKVKINVDGSASSTIITSFSGALQDRLSYTISAESKAELEKSLYQRVNLPGLSIKDFSYKTDLKEGLPQVTESIDLSFDKYFTFSGRRLFLSPNLLNRMSSNLEKDQERKTDIYIRLPYTDEDKIEYLLPESYTAIESKPADVNLSGPFGEFTCTTRMEGNKLLYTRRFIRKAGKFKAARFNELCEFYNAIDKADRARIVLVKKEI